MIKKAVDLVNPGEKAIVVFTRGEHFEHDNNGKGFTGYWVAGGNTIEQIDKVIVYVQDTIAGTNKVYLGTYSHWEPSPRPGRKNIFFSGLEYKGLTGSNWREFGGTAWSPTFYLPSVGEW
jgi:hypothetical protein